MLTRRQLLKYGAVGTAGLLLPFRFDLHAAAAEGVGPATAAALDPATLSKFVDALPIPRLLPRPGGGVVPLPMTSSEHVFASQLPATPTLAYGGASYLGPTIEARRDRQLTLVASYGIGTHPLAASMDQSVHGTEASDAANPRVTVHLHGGNVEEQSDGWPEDTIVGGKKSYRYANTQDAAPLWYHDHAIGITRLNVYAGLAGLYWLRDDVDTGLPNNSLGLPVDRYEIPLVLQDRAFHDDGTFAYPAPSWVPMVFGNVAVVNGKAWPNLGVDRGWYRFRIYNGSNSRTYTLGLSNGQPLYQVGSDGGLLESPLELPTITLSPGERADVLIDFSQLGRDSTVRLVNTWTMMGGGGGGMGGGGGGMGGGMGGGGMGMHPALPELMQFTGTGRRGWSITLPGRLRDPIPRLPQPMGSMRVRNLALINVTDPATGVVMPTLANVMWHHAIEHPHHLQAMPMYDTVEQWNIINCTMDLHPIHLHLVQFQVLGRQRFRVGMYVNRLSLGMFGMGPFPSPSADTYTMGPLQAPAANELGWKDTVQANPMEITRILVPFGPMAAEGLPFNGPFAGRYVWHCHILEHEDHHMMLPFTVMGGAMPMEAEPAAAR